MAVVVVQGPDAGLYLRERLPQLGSEVAPAKLLLEACGDLLLAGKAFLRLFEIQDLLPRLGEAVPHRLPGPQVTCDLLEPLLAIRLLAPGVRLRLDGAALRQLQALLLLAKL